MTEKGGISEMGGQHLVAHPSIEGGGKYLLGGPEWRVRSTTVRLGLGHLALQGLL